MRPNVPARLRAGFLRIADDIRGDLDRRRGFLWWPVAFGMAAATYLLLPVEPTLREAAVPTVGAMLIATVIARRRGGVPILMVLLVVAGCGFLAGKLGEVRADAPRLERERTVMLYAFVEAVEDRGRRGLRLLLRPVAMEPMPPGGMPFRVRLSLRGAEEPVPGSAIRVRARIGPPQPPLIPGGYDFARTAYFQGIGGVGFALGKPEPWTYAPPPDETLSAAAAIERFRHAVSERIRAMVPGDAGAIAAALIVGDRGAIDPAVDEAMRISGLSHVLSISGLHMALVAACLFGGLRALLALIPAIVLAFPVKKIAAGAALVGTVGYLVVSGMEVPAQRSAVMVGLSLAAVMLDRQAISLRIIAVAALLILAIQPQAVLDPGAQMSFAAVTALVAGYEALAARRGPPLDKGDINPLVRGFDAAVRWVGASLLTSLIAGLATTPIALYHFNRLAPLGVLANLAATPLIAFLIMPAGLVGALAMPFGLEHLPLAAMGWGIERMVGIAEMVAAWTPAGGALGRPALAGILLSVAGGLWLCLWTGRNRLLGWIPIVAGLVVGGFGPRPDLIVSGTGDRALVVRPDGSVAVLGRADGFATELWLAALGDPRPTGDPSLVAGVSCDREACILSGVNGRTEVALVRAPIAFGEECVAARLIITPLEAPSWCAWTAAVIDGRLLGDGGARTYAIGAMSWNGEGPLMPTLLEKAIPERGRPWQARQP